MIPLALVVFDELDDRPSQMRCSERDHLVEAFVLDRAQEKRSSSGLHLTDPRVPSGITQLNLPHVLTPRTRSLKRREHHPPKPCNAMNRALIETFGDASQPWTENGFSTTKAGASHQSPSPPRPKRTGRFEGLG
jgi:hypothetical protein